MASSSPPSTASQTSASSAPASRPPAKPRLSRTLIVVLVIVVVVVLGVGAYAIGSSTTTKVTAESWAIDYAGTSSGYFGPSPITYSLSYTFTTSADFGTTLTVTNSGAVTHNVSAISVASPFTFVSTVPGLPVDVAPGTSVTITIQLAMPSSSGTYTLSGTVTTY